MQMKAFRLSKYVNCGKVLKCFDAFAIQYNFTNNNDIKNFSVKYGRNNLSCVLRVKMLFIFANSHAYLT